jgi:hypothetical protein
MPGDAHLTGERHIVFDHGAAGDADLGGEQHVAAHAHTVRHLDEVVDLSWYKVASDASVPDASPPWTVYASITTAGIRATMPSNSAAAAPRGSASRRASARIWASLA